MTSRLTILTVSLDTAIRVDKIWFICVTDCILGANIAYLHMGDVRVEDVDSRTNLPEFGRSACP